MHVTKKLFVRTSRRAAIVPNYGHMLQLEFVSGANREKYREFCGNRPSTSISMPSRRAKINRFPEFPKQRNREFTKSYQGIFLTVTGNRAQWAESRSLRSTQKFVGIKPVERFERVLGVEQLRFDADLLRIVQPHDRYLDIVRMRL